MKGFRVIIYIQVHTSECKEIRRCNVKIEFVCDEKVNDNMYDRVICSQVILIIKCMP